MKPRTRSILGVLWLLLVLTAVVADYLSARAHTPHQDPAPADVRWKPI